MPVPYEWLMPLAPWEPAERLLVALSSLCQQTWPAKRLVVSVDGQLSDKLSEVLSSVQIPLLVLESETWRGTGPTLAAGLSACECDWVLRADADDQSLPHRAELQLSYLLKQPHLAVLGGQLRENSKGAETESLRKVPITDQQIKNMMNWRNAINHPTVALKRSYILSAGNYRDVLGFEDWDLWLRLFKKGAVMANMTDILVMTEIDIKHLERRHGKTYARREIKFLLRCYREGLLQGWRVALLLVARLPWRILPTFWLARMMSLLRSDVKCKSIQSK